MVFVRKSFLHLSVQSCFARSANYGTPLRVLFFTLFFFVQCSSPSCSLCSFPHPLFFVQCSSPFIHCAIFILVFFVHCSSPCALFFPPYSLCSVLHPLFLCSVLHPLFIVHCSLSACSLCSVLHPSSLCSVHPLFFVQRFPLILCAVFFSPYLCSVLHPHVLCAVFFTPLLRFPFSPIYCP